MSHWSPSSFNFLPQFPRNSLANHCSDWIAFYWFERVILTRSSHSQLRSLYIFRHHQNIKWASCDYQDTTSLTGAVGVESDLSLWWCNGRVKHFKNMTFSIKGRGGVLIEYSSLTYSLKKLFRQKIFFTQCKWRKDLMVFAYWHSFTIPMGLLKQACMLTIVIFEKIAKNIRLNVVIQFLI